MVDNFFPLSFNELIFVENVSIWDTLLISVNNYKLTKEIYPCGSLRFLILSYWGQILLNMIYFIGIFDTVCGVGA